MDNEQSLLIGEKLRYSKALDSTLPQVEGLRNYRFVTRSTSRHERGAHLERGINPMRDIMLNSGESRRPAILIRSSVYKIGSDTTPWQDVLEPNEGYVRYFGDARPETALAAATKGNRLLLSEFHRHSATERTHRIKAVPLLFFKGERHNDRLKGFVSFQGFGVVRRVELVTQQHPRTGQSFTNYRYDCVVLSMKCEGERFDWRWIETRRDPAVADELMLAVAPEAWRRWVEDGHHALDQWRRRISTVSIISPNEQRPQRGSREERALCQIYDFYRNGRNHRFEALASEVVASIVSPAGVDFRKGWLTRRSSDGGWDFVQRFDIGSGLARAKVLVLGQAKCVDPGGTTGGEAIARTVARLRRGWIGAFVTTGAFSRAVQAEVAEDEYPIVLVNGCRLAAIVLELSHTRGFSSVAEFLAAVDAEYDLRIEYKHPKEILHD